VKFRRRYAAARAKALGEFAFVTTRLAVVAAVLVWVGGLGWRAWQESDYLRVQGVRFEGDIPSRLPPAIPIRDGMRLFDFNSSRLEEETLRRFVELKDVSIRRCLDRTVVIKGEYRDPVALLASPSLVGIDAFGVAFPLPKAKIPARPLAVIDAPARERANAVAVLRLWERKLPAFFDVVKKLECDRMRAFRVELSDGVMVEWGSLDSATAVEKARKVLRLMTAYAPDKAPASLKFVTDDRIVMDAAWRPMPGKSREGGPIVKT
jgi:cell division septal protein FtsQ